MIAVQADVGDPAPALRMHQRLIRAAALQVVVTDQFHVAPFRLIWRLSCRGSARSRKNYRRQTTQQGARIEVRQAGSRIKYGNTCPY